MADDDSDSRWKKAAKAGGRSMSQSGQDMMSSASDQASEGARDENERSLDQANQTLSRNSVPSYKRGGVVRKTGLARVHKGERVIPVKKRGKKRVKSGRY